MACRRSRSVGRARPPPGAASAVGWPELPPRAAAGGLPAADALQRRQLDQQCDDTRLALRFDPIEHPQRLPRRGHRRPERPITCRCIASQSRRSRICGCWGASQAREVEIHRLSLGRGGDRRRGRAISTDSADRGPVCRARTSAARPGAPPRPVASSSEHEPQRLRRRGRPGVRQQALAQRVGADAALGRRQPDRARGAHDLRPRNSGQTGAASAASSVSSQAPSSCSIPTRKAASVRYCRRAITVAPRHRSPGRCRRSTYAAVWNSVASRPGRSTRTPMRSERRSSSGTCRGRPWRRGQQPEHAALGRLRGGQALLKRAALTAPTLHRPRQPQQQHRHASRPVQLGGAASRRSVAAALRPADQAAAIQPVRRRRRRPLQRDRRQLHHARHSQPPPDDPLRPAKRIRSPQ